MPRATEKVSLLRKARELAIPNVNASWSPDQLKEAIRKVIGKRPYTPPEPTEAGLSAYGFYRKGVRTYAGQP